MWKTLAMVTASASEIPPTKEAVKKETNSSRGLTRMTRIKG
jgi:hypothetical protein